MTATKQLRINGPTLEPEHLDYSAEGQFALEPSLLKLLQIAEQAGWDRTHVALAAFSVCADYAKLTENSPVLQ